jgi:hypothetical protein
MVEPHLTKSRYIAGLQCLRRLWLLVHEPQDYQDPPPGSPLDFGQEIGRKAHLLFPGGTLVSEEPWQHAEAVRRTAALMADDNVPAIFEAAFAFGNVRIRVDVLERRSAGWALLEVKSSSRVKDHHLNDVALQVHMLRSAGIPLSAVEVMHVNTDYIRGPGAVDWSAFFAPVDVAAEAEARRVNVPDQLPAMHDSLAQDTLPRADPGKHCGDPYECEFWDRCTADKPADWIAYLPRLTQAQSRALEAMSPRFPTSRRISR